jgi:PqqD family protein of HPr-rel-A system
MTGRQPNSALRSADGEIRWRRGNPDDCIWFDGDDAFVVYHRPSGTTHLMNDASSTLLRELLREPMSLAEIAAVCDAESASQSPEYIESLADMLKRFAQLGFVEIV